MANKRVNWHLNPPWWGFDTTDSSWGIKKFFATRLVQADILLDMQWFTMKVRYD